MSDTPGNGGTEQSIGLAIADRCIKRPVFATMIDLFLVVLVASTIPIAPGHGPGSAGRASMAKVIIGGQMLCLLLSLPVAGRPVAPLLLS